MTDITEQQAALIRICMTEVAQNPEPPVKPYDPTRQSSAGMDQQAVKDEILNRQFKGFERPDWLSIAELGFLFYLSLKEREEAEAAAK